MNKKDLSVIEKIIIKLIELNIMVKNKNAEYFYDRLEMNILIELIEDIDTNLKKLSKSLKEKYKEIDWQIIEKEYSCDDVFGKSMNIGKAWKLASSLYEKLYKPLMGILESELENYFHSLCIQRQFLAKK